MRMGNSSKDDLSVEASMSSANNGGSPSSGDHQQGYQRPMGPNRVPPDQVKGEMPPMKRRVKLRLRTTIVVGIIIILLVKSWGEKLSSVPKTETPVATKAKTPRAPIEKHTAIILRTMMPIKLPVLSHILQLSRAMATSPKFQHYDFFLMVDETKQNGTADFVQRYFDKMANTDNTNGYAIPIMPHIFNLTEQMIRQTFAPGLEKYIQGPLVNNETGQCCNRPILWQLSVPPIVAFAMSHNYSQSWVFEDDAWALGKGPAPILDLLYAWDQKLNALGCRADLAAIQLRSGSCPFTAWARGRHTQEFETIVRAMHHNNRTYNNNTHFLDHFKAMKQKTSLVPWTFWNETMTPRWACVSDMIYRHSREFSLSLYKRIKHDGVFRFGEGFLQPMAWSGNYTMVDLETLLSEEERPLGFDAVGFKVTDEQALDIYLSPKNNQTSKIYHAELTVQTK
jgi:hypothetical protein